MAKPKVFIGTPTTGLVHAEYCASLAGMIQHLHRQGIDTRYAGIDGSPAIADKRDWLTREFIDWTEATHLLFVDSDMAFADDLAFKLLSFDKDLIGAICTRRTLDLDAYAAAIEKGATRANALALAHDFVFQPDENKQISVSGDLCRVAGLGAGFMLISRRCIEALMPTAEEYVSFRGRTVARVFARMTGDDGQLLGEDYALCRRWREAGGHVWAYTKAQILHCGTMRYGVPFDRYLAAAFGHRTDQAQK